MKRVGIDLLVFAGGDGTARDVHSAVGEALPMLGIPAGVKMHSGVFATSPASAGNLLADIAANSAANFPLREAEVVDIDEDALRDGRVSTRLYGLARVPYERQYIRGAKARPAVSDEVALDALGGQIAAQMENDRLYIFGPGRTAKRVLDHLGLGGSLLGVDAVRNRALVGTDLNERQLLSVVGAGPATIIVGVVGGQGSLFGRGNQQISAEVIRRVGPDNIMVISGSQKLLALQPPVLHVDTGDDDMDRSLVGFARIHVAPGHTWQFRVMA